MPGETEATSCGPSAAVVGAGLAGLTAAYRLQQRGWRVKVFEAGAAVGGRVQTVLRNGYVIDTGASGLSSSYHAYFALAKELDLQGQISTASPDIGIYRGGRIHHLRLDRMLRSALTTRLIGAGSKVRALRLAADVVKAVLKGQLDFADLGKAAALDTESAQQYALRALNPELEAYLCSPIIRTMLIAETEQISKVELYSGLANIFSSQIHALEGGLARMPSALAQHLEVSLKSVVQQVSDRGDGVTLRWVTGEATHADVFDACIIACPLTTAARICPDHGALLEPIAHGLRYTKAITVALGTRKLPESPAFLVLMPKVEDADVALLFLEHNKAPGLVPAGHGLLGCDWAADSSSRWFEASDEAIIARTQETIAKVFPELNGQVDYAEVTRWPEALPHTKAGAYKLIAAFNAAQDRASRIQFAGDYMSGAGQNTAVEFGNRAAAVLTDRQFPRRPLPIAATAPHVVGAATSEVPSIDP